MDKLHRDFVNEVRARMAELGITQKELAERIGAKQQNISRLLAGEHSPTLETVARIAKALGCRAVLRLPPK